MTVKAAMHDQPHVSPRRANHRPLTPPDVVPVMAPNRPETLAAHHAERETRAELAAEEVR